ncbi:MAG: hypothetical protein KAJ93_05920 [Methanosarcinales archaeon]|nr:hypothetical protein [Methanosarcinales archaeon]
MWIHVAWVLKVDNVKSSILYESESCPLLHWCLRAGADALGVGFGHMYSVVVGRVPPWLKLSKK